MKKRISYCLDNIKKKDFLLSGQWKKEFLIVWTMKKRISYCLDNKKKRISYCLDNVKKNFLLSGQCKKRISYCLDNDKKRISYCLDNKKNHFSFVWTTKYYFFHCLNRKERKTIFLPRQQIINFCLDQDMKGGRPWLRIGWDCRSRPQVKGQGQMPKFVVWHHYYFALRFKVGVKVKGRSQGQWQDSRS